jgi:hypothetical protein
MLRSLLVIFLILHLVATYAARAEASSISCPGGIVSSGDSVVDLLVKCGQPVWKESHQEEITDHIAPNRRQRTYVTVESWTYDFGPQQLLRFVTIRNGVVAGVRTGREYGRSEEQETPKPECGDRIISTGDTKSDVLAKCGEPFYRTSHDEEVRERLDDNLDRNIIVTIEEWTYNFGPQRFMRIVTFRNGRVVDVRTGNYGVR